MEKMKIDESQPGPVPRVDRFGFVKQEPNTPAEVLATSKSAFEYERYARIPYHFNRPCFRVIIGRMFSRSDKFTNGDIVLYPLLYLYCVRCLYFRQQSWPPIFT